MDRDAERRCTECYGWQLVTKNVPPPPVKPTVLPKQRWEEVAMDLTGPLPSGEYLMASKQPPAKPSFIDWTPNSQDMDYLKACVLTMAQTFCLNCSR